MVEDTVGFSMELLLGAILIFLVLVSGFYVVISANDRGTESDEENVVSAKFEFGIDDKGPRGKVMMKDLDTEENLKVKIVENTFVSEFSNEYLFNMEEEAVWISIENEGKTVYIGEGKFGDYKGELMNMRGYLLENVIGTSGFENETFEIPFLGRNRVYNLEINPDFPDENFRYN